MPALVIGSLNPVPGVVAARRTVVEAVERERAYDNTMLATKIADEKIEIAIEVTHLTAAQVTTLDAALDATPPVTCSGDLLGGSAAYHIQKTGSNPVLGILPLRWMVTFTMHLA